MKKLAIILAALMLLSILPMTAFAAEGTTVYLSPNENWLQGNARFAVYYFGGAAGEGWVSMTADGEYYTATVPSDATIIFCRMNPDTADNNWNNKWNQTADLPLPTDGSNCYTVEPDSWDRGNGVWSVKGADPGFTPVDDYYCVAGYEGLCGVSWDASSSTPNKMTLNAEGKYEITFEGIVDGTYEFKVSLNNWQKDWGDPTSPNGNYQLTLDVTSNVTITFNADTETIETVITPVGGQTPDVPVVPINPVFTVAGSEGLCGANWDPAQNEMTLNADGLYEITFQKVAGGNYEFKIADGSWDNSWGVDGVHNGQNISISLAKEGDVTILFNAETKAIEVKIQLNEEAEEVEFQYYVAGTAGLCGEEWAAGAEANKMTLNADGLYELILSDIEAGDHAFKITVGTWDASWGGEGKDGNYEFHLNTKGAVKILFNAETKTITVEGDTAPTGDNSFIYGFVALMVISAAAVVVLAKKKAA